MLKRYLTGRPSRTLTLSGDIRGVVSSYMKQVMPSPCPMSPVNETFTVAAEWRLGTSVMPWVKVVADPVLTTAKYCMTVYLGPAWSVTDVLVCDPYPTSFEPVTATGRYLFEAQVEEYVGVTDGGTSVGEDGVTYAVGFGERLVLNSYVTATITMDGWGQDGEPATLTLRGLVTESVPIYREIAAYRVQLTGSIGDGVGVDGLAECSARFLGAECEEHNYTEDGTTWSASGNKASVAGGPGSLLGFHVELAPPQEFRLAGALRADASPYGGPATVRVHRKQGETWHETEAAAGWFSDAYKQTNWMVKFSKQGAPAFAYWNAVEWDPVRCELVPPDGEPAALTRLPMRGRAFDAMTLGHAASQSVEGQFTVSGTGTVTRNITATSFAGYRYLRIVVRASSGNSPFTVRIGNKEWTDDRYGSDLVANESDATYDIDLCLPTNITGTTDGRDSRFPTSTSADVITGDGCMWGVDGVSAYVLADLASGATYTFTSIQLVRNDHALLSCLPSYGFWPVEAGAGMRPFLKADVDGRQALEEVDAVRTGAPSTYSSQTLADLITAAQNARNPAWTCSMVAAINQTDGVDYDNLLNKWLNKNRPATWTWGGGALWARLSGDGYQRWHYLDTDVRSAVTLPAQEIVDEVGFYPGIGDAFCLRDGAHCGEYWSDEHPDAGILELRAAAYLRGAAWGVVGRENRTPLEGARVFLRDASYAAAGEAISDLQGGYRTGPVYAKGGPDHHVVLPPVVVTETFYARKRHRVCFIGGCDCCRDRTLIAIPAYFPFAAQTGDAWIVPLEQWRPIPPVGASEDGEARRARRQSPRAAEIRAYVEHLRRAPV